MPASSRMALPEPGYRPPPPLEDEDLELRAEMQKVWASFDHLEQAWLPGSSSAQVTALQQVFSLVTDLELRLRRREAQGAALRERCAQGMGPYLRRLDASLECHLFRRVIGAWHLEASRSARVYDIERLEQGGARDVEALQQALGASEQRLGVMRREGLSSALALLPGRSARGVARRALVGWRLWARGLRQHAQMSQRCTDAVVAIGTAESRRVFESVLGRWHRYAATGAKERRSREAELDREGLLDQIREQQDLSSAVRSQLDGLARRHEALGEQCLEVRRQMDAWSGPVPASSSSAPSPSGAGAGAGSAGGAGPQARGGGPWRHGQLAALHHERTATAGQHRAASLQCAGLRDRLEHAVATADALQLRIDRFDARAQFAVGSRGAAAVDGGEREDVARQLAGALQARQDMEHELVQLQSREGRLRRTLAELDLEIEAATARPEEFLTEGLRNMNLHFEGAMATERSQAAQLRERLVRAEQEAERLRAEHHGERENWRGEMQTLQLEKDAEANLAHQQLLGLEHQLGEARSWVEHLKEFNDSRLTGNRQLEGQEVQLDKIKQAITDLTDVSTQFFAKVPAPAVPPPLSVPPQFGQFEAQAAPPGPCPPPGMLAPPAGQHVRYVVGPARQDRAPAPPSAASTTRQTSSQAPAPPSAASSQAPSFRTRVVNQVESTIGPGAAAAAAAVVGRSERYAAQHAAGQQRAAAAAAAEPVAVQR